MLADEGGVLGGSFDGDIGGVVEPESLGLLVGPADADRAEGFRIAGAEASHVAADPDLGVEERAEPLEEVFLPGIGVGAEVSALPDQAVGGPDITGLQSIRSAHPPGPGRGAPGPPPTALPVVAVTGWLAKPSTVEIPVSTPMLT